MIELEAEQALVAAAINSAERHDQITETLDPEDFGHSLCNLIYRATNALREKGRDVDPITVGSLLERSGKWDAEHGPAGTYIAALCDVGSEFHSVQSYIGIVKDAAVSRNLIDVSTEIADLAYQDIDTDEKIARALSLLDPLGETKSDELATYPEAIEEALQEVIRRVECGGGLSGLATGLEDLDSVTNGLQAGDLIVLAGRPSMGKTALAMTIANNVAAEGGSVLIYSLEMSKSSLALRSLSSLGSVHFTDIRRGLMDSESVERLGVAKQRAAEMRLRIDDRGGISVDQLRTRARVAARKEKPDLILVDYLTLLSGKGDNRTNEIGYVSRSLKVLAKELNCPVLCLAQLNRGVDSRTDKRPMMSDLRDSGAIEQDADLILFNYLHEKYDPDTPRQGLLELIIGKQRNGETGSVFLGWQAHYQRFVTHCGPIPPLSDEPEHKPGKLGRVVNRVDFNEQAF